MNKWWVNKYKGNDPVFIYSLTDPRNGELFYVGKTRNNLRQRMHLHCSHARKGSRCSCAQRIRDILAAGIYPEIILIEETTMKAYREREKFWITKYNESGYVLANEIRGGGGMI